MEEFKKALLILQAVKLEKEAEFQGTGTTRELHTDGTTSLMTEYHKATRAFWNDRRVAEVAPLFHEQGLGFNPNGFCGELCVYLRSAETGN